MIIVCPKRSLFGYGNISTFPELSKDVPFWGGPREEVNSPRTVGTQVTFLTFVHFLSHIVNDVYILKIDV